MTRRSLAHSLLPRNYHVLGIDWRRRLILPLLLVIIALGGSLAQAQNPTPFPDNYKIVFKNITHRSAFIVWEDFFNHFTTAANSGARITLYETGSSQIMESRFDIRLETYLKALKPSTNYTAQVTVQNNSGSIVYGTVEATFRTKAAPNSGQISNLSVANITRNSATISWDDSGPSGRYSVYVNQIDTGKWYTATTVNLQNLQPGTNYVISIEKYLWRRSGNTLIDYVADFLTAPSFRTLVPPTSTPLPTPTRVASQLADNFKLRFTHITANTANLHFNELLDHFSITASSPFPWLRISDAISEDDGHVANIPTEWIWQSSALTIQNLKPDRDYYVTLTVFYQNAGVAAQSTVRGNFRSAAKPAGQQSPQNLPSQSEIIVPADTPKPQPLQQLATPTPTLTPSPTATNTATLEPTDPPKAQQAQNPTPTPKPFGNLRIFWIDHLGAFLAWDGPLTVHDAYSVKVSSDSRVKSFPSRSTLVDLRGLQPSTAYTVEVEWYRKVEQAGKLVSERQGAVSGSFTTLATPTATPTPIPTLTNTPTITPIGFVPSATPTSTPQPGYVRVADNRYDFVRIVFGGLLEHYKKQGYDPYYRLFIWPTGESGKSIEGPPVVITSIPPITASNRIRNTMSR